MQLNTLNLSLSLCIAISLAVIAAFRTLPPIRGYFRFVAIHGAIVGGSEFVYHWNGIGYYFFYCPFTLVLMGYVFRVCWHYGVRLRVFSIAVILSAGISCWALRTCIFDLEKTVNGIQAFLWLVAGVSLNLQFPFIKESEQLITRVMAALWLLASIYTFHFTLNRHIEAFEYFAGPFMVSVASLFIAVFAPQKENASP